MIFSRANKYKNTNTREQLHNYTNPHPYTGSSWLVWCEIAIGGIFKKFPPIYTFAQLTPHRFIVNTTPAVNNEPKHNLTSEHLKLKIKHFPVKIPVYIFLLRTSCPSYSKSQKALQKALQASYRGASFNP